MAIALRAGQVAHAESQASGTSLSCAFPVGTLSGSLVTVRVCGLSSDGALTAAPTDGTNTYVVSTPEADITADMGVIGWYSAGVASGITTVTANYSPAHTFRSTGIGEFTGAATSAALGDNAGAVNQGTAAAGTTRALVPTVDGCLFWGGCTNDTLTTVAANSPFTLIETSGAGNVSGGSEYFVQGTAANQAITVNQTGTNNWAVVGAIFKPPAAAGGSTNQLMLVGAGQ